MAHHAGPLEKPRNPSRKRFIVLGGPGGWLTCIPAGSPLLEPGQYRSKWQVLMKVNRPLTWSRADCAKDWALRTFELV